MWSDSRTHNFNLKCYNASPSYRKLKKKVKENVKLHCHKVTKYSRKGSKVEKSYIKFAFM